jgi:hypothetical protein
VVVFAIALMLLGAYVATHEVVLCPRCPKCGKPFCFDGDQSKHR